MDSFERLDLTPDDRDRLQKLAKDGNTAQKLVRRARIVLLCADGLGTVAVARRLQTKIIQSFENAGYLRAVARPLDGLTADYQLLVDIRSFQVTLLPEPRADVEFTAKILAADGRIVDARLLHASVPVGAADAPAAAAGLDKAFGKAATELVLWASGVI